MKHFAFILLVAIALFSVVKSDADANADAIRDCQKFLQEYYIKMKQGFTCDDFPGFRETEYEQDLLRVNDIHHRANRICVRTVCPGTLTDEEAWPKDGISDKRIMDPITKTWIETNGVGSSK